ncbi:hypothetical protein TNCV_2466151 [Trichonephila clavipes]|nr:hypothetical protein TNCV_2466151 [Trichonephila clavipes]
MLGNTKVDFVHSDGGDWSIDEIRRRGVGSSSERKGRAERRTTIPGIDPASLSEDVEAGLLELPECFHFRQLSLVEPEQLPWSVLGL